MDRLWRDLFLSVSLHILLWSLFLLLPTPDVAPPPVTIELVETSAKTSPAGIVRQSEIDPRNLVKDNQDPLHFLSERTQRVREQTRALISGLTQNRAPHAAPQTQNSQHSQQQVTPETPTEDSPLNRYLPTPRHVMAPPAQSETALPNGLSSIAEEISSDVKVGDVTSLNTDRYLYYSYFARAQELIWNEWSPRVQNVLIRPPAQLQASPARRYLTVLEVWFYANGQVHSTHLLKPSGIRELDFIAEASFHHIGMIPNPPREKVEADGLIRFKWGLTVEYDPKVLVRQ